MSKVDFSSISFKDLKIVIKQLNKTGLVEENLKVVGVKKEDMIDNFLNAIEAIPEAKESEIPDEVASMYNGIVEILEPKKQSSDESDETEEGGGEEEVEENMEAEISEEEAKEAEVVEEPKEEKPKKAAKKPSKSKKTAKASKESKAKEAKPKKASKPKKTETKKEIEKTKAEIQKEKTKPKSKGEKDALGANVGSGTNKINEVLMNEGGTTTEIAEKVGTKPGRVKNHIYSLIKSGVAFEKDERANEGKVFYSYKISEIPDDFVKA